MSIIAAELTLIDENTALRARVAQLEGLLCEARESIERSLVEKRALRARVAQLEEALTSLIDLRVRIDDMRQANKGMAVERDASRARAAKLEEALRFLFEETKWKSVDKDNMEFEGRVTCYQLDQARAALKDAPK